MLTRLLFILTLQCFVAAKDNVAEIKQYIKQSYLAMYPEMHIESISLIARNELKIYDIEILNKNLSSFKSSHGYIALTYKYKNHVIQESLRYTMQAFITVYTATQNIPAKSNIDSGVITAKRQEFSTLPFVPATKNELLESSARISIPVNTMITQNKLMQKVLVQKDSLVKIVFYSEGIEAITHGKALESGVKGNIIKIQNIESKRIIQAQIIGENEVKLN
ncbi:flagellar basal body P-ring formation chaperone FlgA [Helicobacter aurati]|uniref:flagellar basal body P-ring formation chaperone FlgA n=1 Tax=Helicobacter aurati TaxID=137778 RepID=UPI0013154D8E|nr:flagellar basal body P-ring formation chaperone FlgA [Helicobacter aurati]